MKVAIKKKLKEVENKKLPQSLNKIFSVLDKEIMVVFEKIVEAEMSKIPPNLVVTKSKKGDKNVIHVIRDLPSFIERLETYGFLFLIKINNNKMK